MSSEAILLTGALCGIGASVPIVVGFLMLRARGDVSVARRDGYATAIEQVCGMDARRVYQQRAQGVLSFASANFPNAPEDAAAVIAAYSNGARSIEQ